ncbi:Imm6 family immunity protein [Pseudomonas sp. Z3-6]|uniref:Imm6 family immunity protein n=1 Tax=Pseudomonas sp. Z3-6 TaxID=2817411 RepID=UPI003DA9BC04
MDNKEAIDLIGGMMWTKKAAVFLLVLDHALSNLESAVVTHSKCKEAVELCWVWLSDHSVSADRLAYFLDSDEMQNGPLAEHNFKSESLEQDSLILIMLVVGFFAHQAYKVSGQQKKMSASVCEADEGAAEYIVDYIYKVGLINILSVYLSANG